MQHLTVGLKTAIRGGAEPEQRPCDITPAHLIFCSFILQRSFVVKKLGNTKIDSWIVMPIMTI